MSTMPQRTTSPTLAQTKARANCAQGYHQWHPTFTLGEKLCTVCGKRAYCPFCTSRFPDATVHLVACALHREEGERKERGEG
jgi:hypothetical protein